MSASPLVGSMLILKCGDVNLFEFSIFSNIWVDEFQYNNYCWILPENSYPRLSGAASLGGEIRITLTRVPLFSPSSWSISLSWNSWDGGRCIHSAQDGYHTWYLHVSSPRLRYSNHLFHLYSFHIFFFHHLSSSAD